MEEIIKYSGSENERARDFLKHIIENEEYRYEGKTHRLRTSVECDRSLFKDESEFPIFEASRNPDARKPKYALAKVCVSARDFLQAQALMKDVRYEIYKDSGSPEKFERAKKGMKKSHKVPIPVLEFEEDGELHNFQEGRHRARVALEMDKKYMPVFLAKKVDYQ